MLALWPVVSLCSDVQTRRLDLVCELMEMNIYERIKGMSPTLLRFLVCDAWLCPVSETMELSPHWQRSIRACELPERPHDWGISTSGSATGTRVVRCRPRTEAALRRRREERYKQYEHPEPYLALVMGRGL